MEVKSRTTCSPRKRPSSRTSYRSQSVEASPQKNLSDFMGDRKTTRSSGNKREKLSVHSSYKIGRVIGDGNFAIVKEARHRKTNRKFALKVINKSKVKGKEHMIENEILILRRVRHESIVRLVEEFETPKEIFLVMELVSGGDLFDAIVEVTKFSEPDASHMIKDLSSALLYLHTLNIVHRDIKPENLLVVNNPGQPPSLKLADFGLSIEVKSPLFLVCGTPTYVAPEILDESGYGISVDLWAMGVIAYILLCGFPPFRSNDGIQQELFDKIMVGEFEYLMPFWNGASDSAKDLIDHLLVVDRSKRYSAKDVLEHPWIKNDAQPDPKETVSVLEETFTFSESRVRFKTIVLSIQSFLSLYHLVKRREASIVNFPLQAIIDCETPNTESSASTLSSTSGERSSSSLGNNDTSVRLVTSLPQKNKGLMYFSRIPRLQQSTPCSHIAEIRKSISKTKDESKNNFLDAPTSVKYHTRSSSSRLPRSNMLSSLRSSGAYSGTDQYDVIGAAFERYHHLDSSGSESSCSARSRNNSTSSPSKSKVRSTVRKDYRHSVPPGVLENYDLSSSDSFNAGTFRNETSRCKSAAPPSSNRTPLRSYGSVHSLSPIRRSRYKESEPPKPRPPSSAFKVDSPQLRSKKPSHNEDRHLRRYSMPSITANISKSKTPNNIVLTTKTKRTENITIHSGNTVDKHVDTKTQTTLSVKFDDGRKQNLPDTLLESESSIEGRTTPPNVNTTLLTKVKRLAEEIESLASYDSHSSADEHQPRQDILESEPELDSLEEEDMDEIVNSDRSRDSLDSGKEDCHQHIHYLSLPRNRSNGSTSVSE